MTDNEIIKAFEEVTATLVSLEDSGRNYVSEYLSKESLVACMNAFDLILRKRKEIERLKKYNTEVAYKHYNDGIKEFAERLKEKAYIFESGFEANEDRIVKIVTLKDIDNLLKEMVGDTE